MAFIDFTNGEVLTADQMDTTFRQTVMRFADATARDTALSGVLAEGMLAYLDDTDEVLKYDGASWIDISGDISGVTAGTALTGGGTSGNVTLNVDETALTIAQSQVTDLTTDLADKQDDVITTRGDLVVGNSSGNPVRLGRGSANQVLTSNGTDLVWDDAAGGGGLTLIQSQSVSSSTSTTFSSIPQTYKDLKIYVNTTGASTNVLWLGIKDNNSADQYWLLGVNGAGTSTAEITDLLYQRSASSTSAVFTIHDYTSSNLKTGMAVSVRSSSTNQTGTFGGFMHSRATGNITSITISSDTGLTADIELYGVS